MPKKEVEINSPDKELKKKNSDSCANQSTTKTKEDINIFTNILNNRINPLNNINKFYKEKLSSSISNNKYMNDSLIYINDNHIPNKKKGINLFNKPIFQPVIPNNKRKRLLNNNNLRLKDETDNFIRNRNEDLPIILNNLYSKYIKI